MTKHAIRWSVDRESLVADAASEVRFRSNINNYGRLAKLVHHPVEHATWVVSFLSGFSGIVLRVSESGWEVVADGDAFGLPRAAYVWTNHVFFDTQRQTPILVAACHDENGLVIAAWDGSQFRPIVHEGAAECGQGDAYAFDARRGVLVHFLGDRHGHRGTLVRELDGTTWRERGANHDLQYDLAATWDDARGCTVVFGSRTMSWDGEQWKELPPFEGRSDMAHFATTPEGRAIVVSPGKCCVLGDDAWEAVDMNGVVSCSGGVFDAERGETLFFAPANGEGRPTPLFARLVDRKLVVLPPSISDGDRGIVLGDGRALFWRQADDIFPARGSSTACAAVLDAEGAHFVETPARLNGIVRTPDGALAVTWNGEVLRWEGDRFVVAHPPPPGFVARSGAAVAWIPEQQAILIVGGRSVDRRTTLAEAWQWTAGSGWSLQKSTGKPPRLTDALVVWDTGRSTLVVVGGSDSNFERSEVTFEWNKTKWSRFPNQGATRGLTLVDRDEKTGHVFGISDRAVVVYRGKGTWESVGSLEPDAELKVDEPYAFDAGARRLSGQCGVSGWRRARARVSLAEVLDSPESRTEKRPETAKKSRRAGAPSSIKLSEKGRLRAYDRTLRYFGQSLVFVGDETLLVAVANPRSHRDSICFYSMEGTGTWHERATLEIPFDWDGLSSPTTKLLPWGKGRAKVAIYHGREGWRSAEIDVSSAAFGTWSEPSNLEPKCWLDGAEIYAADGVIRILRSGEEIVIPDPDAGEPSAFGASVVPAGEGRFCVASPGRRDSTFEPRLHEFETASGKLVRTLRFGEDAWTGLGTELCTFDGLRVAACWYRPLIALVSSDSSVELLTDPKWCDDIEVTSGADFLAIGASSAGSSKGAVMLLDGQLRPFAELTVQGAKKSDYFGARLTASGSWLAVSISRKNDSSVYLLRVEGERIVPASVQRDERTPEERFEAAYPGFLSAPARPRSAFRQWQLKAAVHSELASQGHIAPFRLQDFVALYPKRRIDTEKEALVKEAVAYFRFLEIAPDVLAKLESLSFDGSLAIYQELYPFWDGEDGTFDVTDLTGLEQCTGLQSIHGLFGAVDVARLASLPKLREIVLGGVIENLERLAKSKSLERVVWEGSTPFPEIARQALEEARIEVVVR